MCAVCDEQGCPTRDSAGPTTTHVSASAKCGVLTYFYLHRMAQGRIPKVWYKYNPIVSIGSFQKILDTPGDERAVRDTMMLHATCYMLLSVAQSAAARERYLRSLTLCWNAELDSWNGTNV